MTFCHDWEKKHTLVELPESLIINMLSNYYPKEHIKSTSIICGGNSNINVLVSFYNSDEPVILRVYMLEKEHCHKEYHLYRLLENRIPVPKFHYIGQESGYTFAITSCLPGTPLSSFLLSHPNQNAHQIMFQAGELLANFSQITFPKAGPFNTKLEVEIPQSQERIFKMCLDYVKEPYTQSVLPAVQREQIAILFRAYKHLLPDASESHLVHGDYDPCNILITHRNGQPTISGILDWELSFSGSTLSDIASMLCDAHQAPPGFQEGFLEGLKTKGYKLPANWLLTTHLLNILFMLDALKRTTDKTPQRLASIKNLINYHLSQVQKIKLSPYSAQ